MFESYKGDFQAFDTIKRASVLLRLFRLVAKNKSSRGDTCRPKCPNAVSCRIWTHDPFDMINVQSQPTSGKKKVHKHKFFGPVGLGTAPGLSRGVHRVCPWDKPGENLGQTRLFSLFYTADTRQPGFVPGTNPVCPWDNPGDEGRHRKFM